jgi:hypothetical protein
MIMMNFKSMFDFNPSYFKEFDPAIKSAALERRNFLQS